MQYIKHYKCINRFHTCLSKVNSVITAHPPTPSFIITSIFVYTAVDQYCYDTCCPFIQSGLNKKGVIEKKLFFFFLSFLSDCPMLGCKLSGYSTVWITKHTENIHYNLHVLQTFSSSRVSQAANHIQQPLQPVKIFDAKTNRMAAVFSPQAEAYQRLADFKQNLQNK